MKIGDEVFVHGYVDEIRKDVVIIRNEGGYFGTIRDEIRAEQTEPQICDTCRYYNSNIPCGSTPSACKEADKFAEEFVDGLKKLKPKVEPQFDKDINVRSKYKQGTWLYGDGVYCSCCGYKLETTALLVKCPKCGADMSKTDCAWK